MSVASSARRASGSLLISSRRHSLPTTTCAPVRHLNVMLLNPRAPKIRHLNASHSLLIEMEKHVRKVQELEYKVHELEMQLQLKELVKAHTMISQALQSENVVAERKERAAVSEEEQKAFAIRLKEARRKAEQLSAKRDRQEADILRSWQMKKLGSTIDKMSQSPESEVVFLPEQSEVSEKDLACHADMLHGIENLINFAHPADEVANLMVLLEERDNLRKLIEDIEAKENQTNATVEECKNTLYNVNASRTKVNANLKMSETFFDKMQTLEAKRRNNNIFVFGPNPIFSSAKEVELNYSISNEFVINMLKELDITHIIAEKNLKSARECRMKYEENRAQMEESLQLVQETINMQIETVNETKTDVKDVKHMEVKAEVVFANERL
jgi:hypothetical protein